jgi:hypothetical protein
LHPLVIFIFIYWGVALPWGVHYFSLFLFKITPYIRNLSKERHISEIYVLWHMYSFCVFWQRHQPNSCASSLT